MGEEGLGPLTEIILTVEAQSTSNYMGGPRPDGDGTSQAQLLGFQGPRNPPMHNAKGRHRLKGLSLLSDSLALPSLAAPTG